MVADTVQSKQTKQTIGTMIKMPRRSPYGLQTTNDSSTRLLPTITVSGSTQSRRLSFAVHCTDYFISQSPHMVE